jgi:hypothetical protein
MTLLSVCGGLFLSATLSLGSLQYSQNSSLTTEPGSASFSEAVFDKSCIQDLLDKNNCVGLRFYNVVNAGGTVPGTAMAIAYKADGSEINGTFFSHPYRRSDGCVGAETNITKLTCNKAEDACMNMRNAGYISYSASFKKEDIQGLLNVANCNGIRLTPTTTGANSNMIAAAITISDGAVRSLGGGDTLEILSDEPCPTICGDEGNYINGQ